MSIEWRNPTLKRLQKLWVSERCAPELLLYDEEIVNGVKEQVELQQDIVDEERASQSDDGNWRSNVYLMELDRINYVLRCYLRTRLEKIELHVIYILKSPEYRQRLSGAEMEFARNYADLLQQHFVKSALNNLPSQLRGLTDQNTHVDMSMFLQASIALHWLQSELTLPISFSTCSTWS
jgi:GINS complex subunit 4